MTERAYDLYADENEPTVAYSWTTYRLSVPRPAEMKTSEIPFVYVDVDEYGMVNINRQTVWFGEKYDPVISSKSVANYHREIYDWLVEWEFARWIKIGPEDSELFATKKLTGQDYEYEVGR